MTDGVTPPRRGRKPKAANVPAGEALGAIKHDRATRKNKIAAWFLDSDYDGRTFCITQAFFAAKSKWKKLAKALGDQGTIDEAAFEALSGRRSLPFPRPSRLKSSDVWRVGIKVIDPRGKRGPARRRDAMRRTERRQP